MPFVFVHGVNNRQGADYHQAEKIRAAFLRKLVAPVIGVDPAHEIFSPYWGKDGVRFSHDLSVIPRGADLETFGAHEDTITPALGIAIAEGRIGTSDSFIAIASHHPDVAVDLLFDLMIASAQSEAEIVALAEAYQRVQQHLSGSDACWLKKSSDSEILNQLLDVIQPVNAPDQQEVFGSVDIWSMMNEAAKRLALLSVDWLSHAAVALTRRPLTQSVAMLIGDAFRYLQERGDGQKPGPIASAVLDAIRQAAALSRENGEPLVIISHSFGGEIVYDILTHYAKDEDISVDAWVTVGSQVGLFEEMALLWTSPGRDSSQSASAEARVSPPGVKRWLNIIDTNDVLGFLVLPVFTAAASGTVNDYLYDTGSTALGAHSGYFKWPSFYKRLAARLGDRE